MNETFYAFAESFDPARRQKEAVTMSSREGKCLLAFCTYKMQYLLKDSLKLRRMR